MNARPMPPSMIRGAVLGAALLASVSLPATASATRLGPDAPARAPSQGPPSSTTKPAAPSGPIRVTVAPGIDDASLIPTWIDDRHPTVARELALPGHEQWVDVSIAGATYDYRVTVTLIRDGAPLGAPLEPAPCVCNTDELLTLVGEQLAIATERAKSTPVEQQEDRAETRPRVEPEPSLELESAPTRRPDPLFTGVGIGGMVVGAIGIAAIAGGAAMIVIHERPAQDSLYPFFVRDYRPLGLAASSVGGVALAAGITMVALDLTRCRRRPDARGCPSPGTTAPTAASSRRVRVSGVLLPGTTAISLHGRF